MKKAERVFEESEIIAAYPPYRFIKIDGEIYIAGNAKNQYEAIETPEDYIKEVLRVMEKMNVDDNDEVLNFCNRFGLTGYNETDILTEVKYFAFCSPLFSMEDIYDWPQFIHLLKFGKNEEQKRVFNFLCRKCQTIIKSCHHDKELNLADKKTIVVGLNNLIIKKDFYNAETLSKIGFHRYIKELIGRGIENLSEFYLMWLNRLLLDQIFAGRIRKGLSDSRFGKSGTLENFGETKGHPGISASNGIRIQTLGGFKEDIDLIRTFMHILTGKMDSKMSDKLILQYDGTLFKGKEEILRHAIKTKISELTKILKGVNHSFIYSNGSLVLGYNLSSLMQAIVLYYHIVLKRKIFLEYRYCRWCGELFKPNRPNQWNCPHPMGTKKESNCALNARQAKCREKKKRK